MLEKVAAEKHASTARIESVPGFRCADSRPVPREVILTGNLFSICAVQQCGQLADGGAKRLALSGGIAYSNVRMQQDLRVESGHRDALRQHVRPAPRVHIHKALRLHQQTERFWCYWLCWVFGSRRWPGCLPSPETSGGCWPLSGISGGCCPSPDWPPG